MMSRLAASLVFVSMAAIPLVADVRTDAQSQVAFGIDVAQPPMEGVKTAGQAHSYLLIPLAVLAGALGALASRPRARPRLGLVIAAHGLLALAVVLLVDRPAGLDAGNLTSSFAAAKAVLGDGFYAELAAAAGLASAGVLYYARPCRIRISSSGRAASARRRRPRRRDSSPRKAARRPSRPRNGAASARASRP